MRKVKIIGSAITKFGRHPNRNLKSLAAEAVNCALLDANITKEQLQGAWVGNASQGVLEGQESVRGQVVLRDMGIGLIPVVNTENACASSATALNGAWAMVALGEYDVALVLGMEKMYQQDRSKVLSAFNGAMDIELLPQFLAEIRSEEEKIKKAQEERGEAPKPKSGERTIFMDDYAMMARDHMKTFGTTQRQLAAIASKNHLHSSLNPQAQYQSTFTIEEILAAPEVVYPLTRLMCAPIGDGAAAMIICSEDFARKIGGSSKAVDIAASMLGSGEDLVKGRKESALTKIARKAYERAGIAPEDVNVAEVHDATCMGELTIVEELLFCPVGEGGPFAEAGHTTRGGKIPVNVSGGLESMGHPIGATGIRQVAEIYLHLAGKAGKRQIEGARIGLAQNTGGLVRGTPGTLSITILKI